MLTGEYHIIEHRVDRILMEDMSQGYPGHRLVEITVTNRGDHEGYALAVAELVPKDLK